MTGVGAVAADLEALVLRLGATGQGRAEIAAALGLGLEALAAREGEDALLAGALARAADLALAWWEAAPREAFEAGVRFNYGAWAREMERRFGDALADEPEPQPTPEEARAALIQRGRATILIPCNSRTRLRPDGTCPCAGVHDDAYWARRLAKWRIKHPEDFDPNAEDYDYDYEADLDDLDEDDEDEDADDRDDEELIDGRR
jgi:hypothetical protein